MTDNRTTELVSRREATALLEEFLYGYQNILLPRGISAIEAICKQNELIDEYAERIEQVIAATLGNTTCEYIIEDNMNESEGMGDVWFRCTNCGMCYDYYADDWLFKMPHCPKCGAIVKGVR